MFLDDVLKEVSRLQRQLLKKLGTDFQLWINEKFKAPYSTANYLNLIIISNLEGHAVDMEIGDRRNYPIPVVYPEFKTMGEKTAYFKRLFDVPVEAVAAWYRLVVGPEIAGDKFHPQNDRPVEEDVIDQQIRTANGTLAGWMHEKLCLDEKYFDWRYSEQGISEEELRKDF
jgi:hypothetical protein